jgi:ABC-type Fe3+/spermidine/putrescine transport system ATPase subunit
VVYVTHDQQEAMAVSDRIIVMNAGRIEQQGVPRDLYERPKTPFLARFMGESNPARGSARRLDPATVRVRLGGAEIDIADTTAADGDVAVAVRPEAISVELAPGPAGTLAGTIAKSSYVARTWSIRSTRRRERCSPPVRRVERPLAAGHRSGLGAVAARRDRRRLTGERSAIASDRRCRGPGPRACRRGWRR